MALIRNKLTLTWLSNEIAPKLYRAYIYKYFVWDQTQAKNLYTLNNWI